METVLFLAHTQADGSLAKPAFEALNGAKQLADGLKAGLVAGLVGESVNGAANAVAGAGCSKVFGVSGLDFAQARYASDAAAIEALAKAAGATIVVAAGTSRFARVLPGVACRLGGRVDTHVTGLETAGASPTIVRWFYRQRMMAKMSRSQRPWVISVDPGSLPAWQGAAGSASVQTVAVALPDSCTRTTVTGVQAPPADEQTIRPEADLLFVAGAGWTKKQRDGQPHVEEANKLILGFLGKSKASLGGSKSIVDISGEGLATLSFMTHLNQVGQTGATPRHPKGLATCCHGEEPHVVGWRFINERRAVNLDPNCGWAQGKADVLYVADAFEVMRKVIELVAQK